MIVSDLIINNETPAGTINGANKDFTIDHPPDPAGAVELFLDDKFQILDTDYTVEDLTITFVVAPPVDSKIRINYRYTREDLLLLNAGRIIISGATKLEDWRKSGDLTMIDGGSIATNTVTAAKINVVGLNSSGRIVVADVTDANEITDGINSYAGTKIAPGKILISGSTTLDDWSHGSDATKIDGGRIYTNSITASQISAGAIDTDELAANAVTAAKIDVSALSAISADIGTITAGTITGLTLQTHSAANTGVKMTATGGLDIYGQTLEFRNTAGTLCGRIYGKTGENEMHLYSVGLVHFDVKAVMTEDGFDASGAECFVGDLEADSVIINGLMRCDSVRVDITPTAGANAATHYINVNMNGTTYKLLLKS